MYIKNADKICLPMSDTCLITMRILLLLIKVRLIHIHNHRCVVEPILAISYANAIVAIDCNIIFSYETEIEIHTNFYEDQILSDVMD